jgi:DNA-binding transcriptional MerR regulator
MAVGAMTIDELARRAGTTTRNVRSLQTSGLLVHPAILGRTAHYGQAHLARLEAVLRLQGSGFSLASIRVLFEAACDGRTLEDVLGIHPAHRRARSSDLLEAEGAVPGSRAVRLLSIVPSTVVEIAT